jgi:endoglucanase
MSMRTRLLGLCVAATALGACGSDDEKTTGDGSGSDDLLAFEDDWLDVPWDDASDPRTVLGVMGLRHARVIDDSTVELVFGPSFSNYEVYTHGFEIMSDDDPAYALMDFVNPSAIAVTTEPELIDTLGVTANIQIQWVVRMILPAPMQKGATYRVRAIGGGPLPDDIDPEYHRRQPWWGYPLTAGANAAMFKLDMPEPNVTEDVVASVMGLRSVTRVAPNMLKATLGTATAESLVTDPSQYSLSGSGANLQPSVVHRKTGPELYVPATGWPFSVEFLRHEVYLEFANDIPSGKYTLAVTSDLTTGRTELPAKVGSLLNTNLKINQEGYQPDVRMKRAFYGGWLGTGGALDVPDGIPCEVRDASTDAVVWRGSFELRHALGSAGEGPYDVDNSGEEVYACDFGELQDPGSYRVYADGLDYSYPFRIHEDALDRAHQVAMYGVLWQRSGIGLEDTGSRYKKIPGHHEDNVKIPYMADRPVLGGHYDAGDFNPRVHTSIARDFMMVCELMPQKCGDGDLDVPEGINGVPDVLDEAAWSLRPLLDLQDTDGGIGGGAGEWGWSTPVESMADPNFVETPERDPYHQFAGEKNLNMTTYTAGLFAQAAVIWKRFGKDAQANTYQVAAEAAWSYAEANNFEATGAPLAAAAAHMARMTGDASYLDYWDASGYSAFGGDETHEGAYAAAAYMLLPDDMGSELVRASIVDAFLTHGQAWSSAGETYAYPTLHHPWAPTSWGAGCYPTYAQGMVVAHALSQSSETQQWLHTGMDLTLGANALNLSYITGLGDRSIINPLHLQGWHTWQGVMPPGIQSEGPQGDKYSFEDENLVPDGTSYPTDHFYLDTRFVNISMHEPVMVNMGSVAMVLTALRSDSPNVP